MSPEQGKIWSFLSPLPGNVPPFSSPRHHVQGRRSPLARHPTSVCAALSSARSAEREGRREPVSRPALADAPSDNSARGCGGVRRRGKHFGAGKKPRENEKKEERKGGVTDRRWTLSLAYAGALADQRLSCACRRLFPRRVGRSEHCYKAFMGG